MGTAKTNVSAHPITTQSPGASLARLKTAANIAPAWANANATATMATFDHVANVGRERGSESPIPVSPAMRDPGWPQCSFQDAVHSDHWTAIPTASAQDRVLGEPRRARPGNCTDHNQQRSGQNGVDCHRPGNRSATVSVGVLQGRRPIDLVPCRPLLREAKPAVPGKRNT